MNEERLERFIAACVGMYHDTEESYESEGEVTAMVVRNTSDIEINDEDVTEDMIAERVFIPPPPEFTAITVTRDNKLSRICPLCRELLFKEFFIPAHCKCGRYHWL
jgi:hypothetical protein